MSDDIHVYRIGSDGTEYYAAHSAKEMQDWYVQTVGAEEAALDLQDCFEELPPDELDAEFDFNDDGEMKRMTWRRLAAESHELPCQLSSGYS